MILRKYDYYSDIGQQRQVMRQTKWDPLSCGWNEKAPAVAEAQL